jgi:hypothetical protein
VAPALVYLFALWVYGFTGGVVKGKSRVCGSSTRVFIALRVRGFIGSVVKGKSRVCGSNTCGLCALLVCGFTGGVMVSLKS